MKKTVELPDEFKEGGAVDFSNLEMIGWEYDGVLHYFEGKGPEDVLPWVWTGEVAE